MRKLISFAMPVLLLSMGYSCWLGRDYQPIKETQDAKSDSIVIVSFESDIVPILKSHCSPCHFPGGNMYEKMPFDKEQTIIEHREGVLRRIKDEKEVGSIKAFLNQNL